MTARSVRRPAPCPSELRPPPTLVVDNPDGLIIVCNRPVACYRCPDFDECTSGGNRDGVIARWRAFAGVQRIMDKHDPKDVSEDGIAWIARLIRRASVL